MLVISVLVHYTSYLSPVSLSFSEVMQLSMSTIMQVFHYLMLSNKLISSSALDRRRTLLLNLHAKKRKTKKAQILLKGLTSRRKPRRVLDQPRILMCVQPLPFLLSVLDKRKLGIANEFTLRSDPTSSSSL